mgnify:CR=1 FL=1
MTGGQYDLKRRRTASSMRGQSGLELDIIDHINATERSVNTLSGGEAFLASLGPRYNSIGLMEYWDHIPQKIKKYIGRNSARMCYIPLTETKVEKALGYFSVHSQTYPCDSTTIY